MQKRRFSLALLLLLRPLCLSVAQAHPGKTDGNGGHYDRSTGEYHYHHGYPAHQHPNGQCPYDFDDRTGWNSGSSSSGSTKSSPVYHKNYAMPILVASSILIVGAAIAICEIHDRRKQRSQKRRRLEQHLQEQQLMEKQLRQRWSRGDFIPPPPPPLKVPSYSPPQPSTPSAPCSALQREDKKPMKPPSKLDPKDFIPYAHIPLYAADSDLISHVGYDRSTQTLYVRLRTNGKIYTYRNIPLWLCSQFVHSDSLGRFYNQHIKKQAKNK